VARLGGDAGRRRLTPAPVHLRVTSPRQATCRGKEVWIASISSSRQLPAAAPSGCEMLRHAQRAAARGCRSRTSRRAARCWEVGAVRKAESSPGSGRLELAEHLQHQLRRRTRGKSRLLDAHRQHRNVRPAASFGLLGQLEAERAGRSRSLLFFLFFPPHGIRSAARSRPCSGSTARRRRPTRGSARMASQRRTSSELEPSASG